MVYLFPALNDEEVKNLSRCKDSTLNMGRGLNIKYKPYVFTEQGVYMLMTVLHGDLAIKQSRALVKTFKKMKDYLYNDFFIVHYISPTLQKISLSSAGIASVRDLASCSGVHFRQPSTHWTVMKIEP